MTFAPDPLRILPPPALTCVSYERLTQDNKWGEQNHDNGYWLGILGEEFGEVAKAYIEDATTLDELRAELVQVAAVAVAWIECLDRNHGLYRRPGA